MIQQNSQEKSVSLWLKQQIKIVDKSESLRKYYLEEDWLCGKHKTSLFSSVKRYVGDRQFCFLHLVDYSIMRA